MSTATLFAPLGALPQHPQPIRWPAVSPRDEFGVIQTRREEWFAESIAVGGYEAWVANLFVIQTVRLDACHARENAIRQHEMLRAELIWDGDRELDAALLGDKLDKKPAYYLRKLRESPHGCLYLAERWEQLGSILDVKGAWNEAQESSALDMLGVAVELRDGRTPLDPGAGVDRLEHLKHVCRAEIVALTNLAHALQPLDDKARASAKQGIGLLDNKPLKAQQRDERQCQQRLQWAADELARQRGQRTPEPVAAQPKPPEPQPPTPAPQPMQSTPPPPPPAPSPFRQSTSFAPSSAMPPIHENRRARRARMKVARSSR